MGVSEDRSILTVGTVTTTQGTVLSGSTPGDVTVSVDLGTLPVGVTAVVEFEVTLNDPLPTTVSEISNQATLTGSGSSSVTPSVTQTASCTATAGMPEPGAHCGVPRRAVKWWLYLMVWHALWRRQAHPLGFQWNGLLLARLAEAGLQTTCRRKGGI